VTAVEAYNIALEQGQLPAEIRELVRKPKESCTFLINGVCSVYDSRPAICRTFGLPALHRNDKQEGEISWCELNFTQTDENFEFQADGIIDIDMLNIKLSGVNGLFLRESGSTIERIAMDEIPNLDTSIFEKH